MIRRCNNSNSEDITISQVSYIMHCKSYLIRPSVNAIYLEFSDMMVEREGLNTRSLSVSIKLNDAEI